MGSSFSCDFNAIRNHYLSIVKFANENKELLMKDCPILRETVRTYINLDLRTWKIESINQLVWVWSVHKLHPVDYSLYIKNEMRGVKRIEVKKGQFQKHFLSDKEMEEFLVAACIRQREFCLKLEASNYSWYSNAPTSEMKKEYKNFLELVKKHHGSGLLVPTLHEDFVWHSHMQFHQSYARDSQDRFGWLLDHKDDIDPKELKTRSEITKDLRKKQSTPTSCGGGTTCGFTCAYNPLYFNPTESAHNKNHHQIPDPTSCGGFHHHGGCGGGNHSSCGSNCGSSCGSSCGGSCGGGCGGGCGGCGG